MNMFFLTDDCMWMSHDGVVSLSDHLDPVPAESINPREQADRQRAGWMAAAQAGDRRAFERVLAESVVLIRRVAQRKGVADGSVDDVVQETLITVHRVRHTFDPSRSYDAWLTAIATRRAMDALRSSYRRGHREVHDEQAMDRQADWNDASVPSERLQAAGHLHEAIAKLPPGQREAVEHLGLKEQSLAEAAAHTGRSAGALKVNLHRALKALRERMNGEP